MKQLLLIFIFLLTFVYADKSEKYLWDEVKNSSDIELLQLYKKKYPNGLFKEIADIKIKRLLKSKNTDKKSQDDGYWIKGTSKYKFYGIGKANKHFKGKHYQENLARSRAKRELYDLFSKKHLKNEQIDKYEDFIEEKKYINPKGRIYILLYIDNYNIIGD
ncbi:MAG: hypothetical protein CSA86_00715 [Arcobacter sp.]|nr:MAG: hypothetical protein CSA86_00715 [Arcobacter sp.]